MPDVLYDWQLWWLQFWRANPHLWWGVLATYAFATAISCYYRRR